MIGDKVRKCRKSKGMTLTELAELTGVTASFLSQLERNLIDPSLSTLRKLSKVFEISMSSFLDDEGENEPVIFIKSGSGRKLAPQDSISYEYFTPSTTTVPDLKIEVIRFDLAPQTWDSADDLSHDAEECCFVMEGCIDFLANGVTYHLEKGDSIYIRPNVPHRAFNPGTTYASCCSCATPVV